MQITLLIVPIGFLFREILKSIFQAAESFLDVFEKKRKFHHFFYIFW